MTTFNKKPPLALGILISGRGSNLMAIDQAIKARMLNAHIAVVISNNPEAPGLQWAKLEDIECCSFNPKDFPSKAAYENQVIAHLKKAKVDLVILAGYLLLLSKSFINHFRGRIMNIHPSLLPAFAGLHPQKQALDYGAKISGCTVHFVDEGMDTGPIILQKAVPVMDDDTEATLSERILKEEHQCYTRAIELYAEGRLKIKGRVVKITS